MLAPFLSGFGDRTWSYWLKIKLSWPKMGASWPNMGEVGPVLEGTGEAKITPLQKDPKQRGNWTRKHS